MGRYGRIILPVLVMLAACGEAVENGGRAQTLPVRALEVRAGQVLLPLEVEIADDAREREVGLMYRRSMAENAGMLFIWPEAEERAFWMRNTFIPLDIIYVRGGRIVGVVQGKPLDETTLPSGTPADMVLEVNGGWAARHGVAVGDGVSLK